VSEFPDRLPSDFEVIKTLLGALREIDGVVEYIHDPKLPKDLLDGAVHFVLDMLGFAVTELQYVAALRASDDPIMCDVECWATEALFEVRRLRDE
jgi:hypothetical protein